MPTPKPKKAVPQLAKVRVRKAVEPAKALEELLSLVEGLTGTVNELVAGFNGMAEDVAISLSRTQAVEDTLTTLAKGSMKWGPIAEDNNRIAKTVEGVAATNAKMLGDLLKVAEANARVLEELRKRVG